MAVQEMELDALLKAGVFSSKGEAIDEALRLLFTARPQLRTEAALQLFKDGEVTLGRAAEIAGITRWEFEEILADRGMVRVVEPEPPEELERQALALLPKG